MVRRVDQSCSRASIIGHPPAGVGRQGAVIQNSSDDAGASRQCHNQTDLHKDFVYGSLHTLLQCMLNK